MAAPACPAQLDWQLPVLGLCPCQGLCQHLIQHLFKAPTPPSHPARGHQFLWQQYPSVRGAHVLVPGMVTPWGYQLGPGTPVTAQLRGWCQAVRPPLAWGCDVRVVVLPEGCWQLLCDQAGSGGVIPVPHLEEQLLCQRVPEPSACASCSRAMVLALLQLCWRCHGGTGVGGCCDTWGSPMQL